MTEPDPGSNDRQHAFPRGKVLGGSSSINGLLWVRGLPEDYEGWRQLGLAGWGWEDAERYFRRIERRAGDTAPESDDCGPLHVGDISLQHSMLDVMFRAFQEAGAPASEDINGTTREGVARLQATTLKGKRVSAAVAYLHPAMGRSNLQVVTHAHASRVLFEGSRAVGVEYYVGNERREVRAGREVILSGGAINSPQLLELSGIGDAERLRALGVAVVADRPHVGENLQDHFASMVRGRLKKGTPSMNDMSHGAGLVGQMLRYAFTRTGLLATCGSNLTAFLKSDPALDLPNLQFFAMPATVDFEALAINGVMAMEKLPGVTIGGYVMRPQSKGTIHIESGDFRKAPAIRPNYLAEEADQRAQIGTLRWARKVMQAPSLAAYFDHELTPGANMESDEELLAFVRAAGSTGYHQTSTCAMGAQPDSVVSGELKVNGVQGLRVVDASVMPNVVSGNTNAATMMIAEKASDMILADAR
jgi:choline dehydrogenase